ncbi:hypothetical protein N7509_001343 [Penicillium cosmopolitanum]|uniref:DUF7779 domain-containing protein n=1 Tax=Penicillium cosmopolitanum TaxID=1131564 RepID=A0A9W9WC68_9EURO|nr:uncharacterized protein N7509_001343 [Penicillium cosmopolitanum]KAJ5414716.1 hypothetical protein N7509_001343 [Penicillium cosmopolitanum]
MTSISFGNANSGFQVGINQGPIYFSDRQELRPQPLSTVPFPHDPDFVSRDALLDQIHEKAAILGSRIVLVGLGGVGKTRLAIEYCHRVQQQSTNTWVFWVHASNAARCEESLRDLADRAKIPGRQDHNANIFQLVGNWLQNENIGKWILVLDNLDNDELLRNPLPTGTGTQANAQGCAFTQPPLRYLLKSLNGSIIITSRNKGVALDIAGHKKNLINVQPMNMEEALVLLRNKLGIQTESADMIQLVEELEFMPLAIVQASSYVIHRSPRFSISQYLEKIRKSDREAIKLLNYETGRLDRDWEAKNSIILTWQISFDHIRQIRQSAADLLSLMSFFDRQGIPETLLRAFKMERINNALTSSAGLANGSSEGDTDSSSESDLDHDFEDDIATLRDYSLISINEDSTIFNMHRLVQLTARGWLATQGQMERWKEHFISMLCQEFPSGEYKNWERCQSLFPHVKSALSQRPESQESLRKWATLLYNGAWYATESGNIADAREMALNSRKQRVKIKGEEDEESLSSTEMLAMAYLHEGRWEEAEKLQVRVMETVKVKLGEDHPDTLESMNNLASIFHFQSRWEEAEKLFVQVVKTLKAKLGEDHPSTLTSMDNLASTYRSQGRWGEAEELGVQVVKANQAKLGEDHPSTLTSMDNLASTYCNQGRLEDTEKLFVQVMETRKIKLGQDHPDTLMSIGNLASTFYCQCRWEDAEKLFVQVVTTLKAKLGEDHPTTLTNLDNLASTYRNQGRWGEAEQLEMQVTEAFKTKLGQDHPDTVMSMVNLALTWKASGKTADAKNLLKDCLAIQKRTIGLNHPHTVSNSETLLRWEAEVLNIDA